MNTTARFRTVKAPHGTLVHFDYLNDGRTDDVARSTSCGRKVPATWAVETVEDGLAAVRAVTCPTCLQWAGYHRAAEDVHTELAARLGDDWKNQPGNYLPAVDLRAAQQLLVRLQELNDMQELPVAATPAQVNPARQRLLDAGFTPQRAQDVLDVRDQLQRDLADLGVDGTSLTGPLPPLATSPLQAGAGRRAALRNGAAAAGRRMATAMRSLPAAGTPALC